MMNYQTVSKLTVSKDIADTIKEVIDFFDEDIFDDWDSINVMDALCAIANEDKSIEIYTQDGCRCTVVDIEIKD